MIVVVGMESPVIVREERRGECDLWGSNHCPAAFCTAVTDHMFNVSQTKSRCVSQPLYTVDRQQAPCEDGAFLPDEGGGTETSRDKCRPELSVSVLMISLYTTAVMISVIKHAF